MSGDGLGVALRDVSLVERGFLSNRTQGERALGLRSDYAAEDASVFHRDRVEIVRSIDDGVRIHDVLQQVIEVASSAPSEVRPNRAAFSKELMALPTHARIERPTLRYIRLR